MAFLSPTQHGHGESNELEKDMEKTVTAWKFDPYRVRNHLVPNPINSKLIRLRKIQNIFPFSAP